jgi:hypothetical protein
LPLFLTNGKRGIDVKGIKFVLRVWGNDFRVAISRVAGTDGGICGERPLVPEGVTGQDG